MTEQSGPETGPLTARARHAMECELLRSLRARHDELAALLEKVTGDWGYEDPVYRFYVQSFKVYMVQQHVRRIVDALQSLLPDRKLNSWFGSITGAGTGKRFELAHNQRWLDETRPIVEAFFHARYMLQMAYKYGQEFEDPPTMLPSGWAALLCLYNLR